MTVLTISRLRLEPMNDTHVDGLYALNSDPAVMRYITGKPDTYDDTLAGIARVKDRWSQWGFSWWSIFEQQSNELIGAGCIQRLGHDANNPLEIGWRFRPDKWGQGFASEAARRMAQFAFDTLDGELLCAVCWPENTNSSRVMQRLGMRFKGQEVWYDRTTSVYEITRAQWSAATAQPAA